MFQTKRERTLSKMLKRENTLDEARTKDKAERRAVELANDIQVYRSFLYNAR